MYIVAAFIRIIYMYILSSYEVNECSDEETVYCSLPVASGCSGCDWCQTRMHLSREWLLTG